MDQNPFFFNSVNFWGAPNTLLFTNLFICFFIDFDLKDKVA